MLCVLSAILFCIMFDFPVMHVIRSGTLHNIIYCDIMISNIFGGM